jgi:hypothetical protein
MSYDNLSSVSQNVLKFYQQLTGEEWRIPFIFDDFHFCCSRVIGLDMTGTAKVKIVKNERDPPLFIGKLLISENHQKRKGSSSVKRGGSLSFLVGTISNVSVMEMLNRCGERWGGIS